MEDDGALQRPGIRRVEPAHADGAAPFGAEIFLAADESADLTIAAVGSEPAAAAGKTIWLRPDPDAAGKKDLSIYRYDRAALLVALKSAGGGRGR